MDFLKLYTSGPWLTALETPSRSAHALLVHRKKAHPQKLC